MDLRLKVAVWRSGRTQRAIARQTDIAETRLSDLVRGWKQPTEREQVALAVALGESVDALFGATQQEARQ